MIFIYFLSTDGTMLNCNAKYGAIDQLMVDLQSYANANIETSFEYLLMSTHFGNYETNREGFKGLYRKMSDRAWENAIDIIKFITKRGGKMDFNQLPRFKRTVRIRNMFFNWRKILDFLFFYFFKSPGQGATCR